MMMTFMQTNLFAAGLRSFPKCSKVTSSLIGVFVQPLTIRLKLIRSIGFEREMKLTCIFTFIILSAVTSFAQSYPCLPSDIKSDAVVDFVAVTSAKQDQIRIPVTVKQTLKKLRLKCTHGNLVDQKGKSVRFYQLNGCWGNPPSNYLEIMEKQRKDLDDLKKKYTVIEMTCNPSGMPVY